MVYDLRGFGDAHVPGAPEAMMALTPPLNVLCHVVVGKRVQSEAFGGRLTELSVRSGALLTPRRLRALSNVKLELRPPDRAPLEIYAKVVHVSGDGQVACASRRSGRTRRPGWRSCWPGRAAESS